MTEQPGARSSIRLAYSLVALLGGSFGVAFAVVVIPALVRDSFDIIGGLAAGFVNSYAAGYSLDVLFCWAILGVWIVTERRLHGVRHGYWCLILGVVPGVATGLAVYLLIRHRHFHRKASQLGRWSAQ